MPSILGAAAAQKQILMHIASPPSSAEGPPAAPCSDEHQRHRMPPESNSERNIPMFFGQTVEDFPRRIVQ